MNNFPAILYVEDDPPSREIMELLLVGQMELSNVHIFDDSKDFMPRLEKLNSKPDMILLDIHVRPYSGFEMLQMIRAHDSFRHIPVVALTASVMNEEVQQLKEAGFSGVIAKPIDMDSFPALLDRILNGEAIWSIVI